MKRRILIFVLLMQICNHSFAQEWFMVFVNFKFTDIDSNMVRNPIFSYIEGNRTHSENLIFLEKSKIFKLSFWTMGGGPLLLLRIGNDKMVILINERPGETKLVTLPYLKESIYEIKNSALKEITDTTEVQNITHYINNRTEHKMEVHYK